MTAQNTQTTHSGHKARLRERFRKAPRAMPDYELIEMLLGYVLLRKDTKPLARELLKEFGSLRGIFEARQEQIALLPGAGKGVADFLLLMHEILARYAAEPAQKRKCATDALAVSRMARARFAGASTESAWLALLDSGSNLLAWKCLREGCLHSVQLEPRDVLKAAIENNATAYILVHNHPGGDASPSRQDINFTQKLRSVSEEIGIHFLDHIIVTDRASFSFASDGIIDETGGL